MLVVRFYCNTCEDFGNRHSGNQEGVVYNKTIATLESAIRHIEKHDNHAQYELEIWREDG